MSDVDHTLKTHALFIQIDFFWVTDLDRMKRALNLPALLK